MPQSDKKRYVVTYANPDISKEEVGNLLNVGRADVEDGVGVMASERIISDADILHFDNIGATVVSLTDAQKKALEKRDDVLEVVEDFEMHALDAVNGQTEYLDAPLDTDTAAPDTGLTAQQTYMLGFNDGYKAMQDRLKELMEAPESREGTETSPVRPVPSPVLPRPIPPIVPFPPILRQPIPWNIQLVKAPGAWSRGIRGDNVKVAVLDTGIATHTDLIVSGGASFVPGVVSFNDDNGHGTHCAGIVGARDNFTGIVGVAPRCRLYAVKVLNSAGSGSFTQIVAGLSWSLANKMDVVSMSLGAVMPCQNAPLALRNAINQLIAAGITVVAAAGNSFNTADPANPNGFVNIPASIPGVIAVAATNQANGIAPFSSRGGACNPVTLSAPGVKINSTYPFPANAYRELSGTSMACPHVAGAVALIKQKFPAFTPAQIRFKLVSTAGDLGAPGTDPTFGAGLLNCNAATL